VAVIILLVMIMVVRERRKEIGVAKSHWRQQQQDYQ